MSPVPPVTIALMLACVAIYVRQVWVGGLDNRIRVVETGAMSRDEVLHGELWRLISGGFLHANAEHLIGNMIMLFILGMACEHAFGRGPFLFLYVSACVTARCWRWRTTMPTVGASGAIFGLAGALLSSIVAHRHRIELRDHRVAIVLAVWATYTLALGLLSPIVSNACHLGGLLGGLILGWLAAPGAADRPSRAGRPAVDATPGRARRRGAARHGRLLPARTWRRRLRGRSRPRLRTDRRRSVPRRSGSPAAAGRPIDRLFEEPGRAVAEQEIRAARMPAREPADVMTTAAGRPAPGLPRLAGFRGRRTCGIAVEADGARARTSGSGALMGCPVLRSVDASPGGPARARAAPGLAQQDRVRQARR